MGQIKAVIFDLDDTLYSERQYVQSGYAAVGRHLRKALARNEAFEDWLWDRFCGGQLAGAFDALNDRFKLRLADAKIGELVRVYREHDPQIRPFEGTGELLGHLHQRYRLGLLSDGFLPAQKLKLQALRLERFFDAVVFTAEMGRECWKPSPAGFQRIRQMLDVPDEACAYVGDNPAKDFIAPNALGWRTIRYCRPGQVYHAAAAPDGGEPKSVVRLPGQLHEALL